MFRFANVQRNIMQIRMKPQQEDVERIAALIEAARERKGWSSSELARRANVDVGQVSRICSAQSKTVWGNAVLICRALGMDLNRLVDGDLEGAVDDAAADRRLIQALALKLWDRSVRDTDRVADLLRQLTELLDARSG